MASNDSKIIINLGSINSRSLGKETTPRLFSGQAKTGLDRAANRKPVIYLGKYQNVYFFSRSKNACATEHSKSYQKTIFSALERNQVSFR